MTNTAGPDSVNLRKILVDDLCATLNTGKAARRASCEGRTDTTAVVDAILRQRDLTRIAQHLALLLAQLCTRAKSGVVALSMRDLERITGWGRQGLLKHLPEINTFFEIEVGIGRAKTTFRPRLRRSVHRVDTTANSVHPVDAVMDTKTDDDDKINNINHHLHRLSVHRVDTTANSVHRVDAVMDTKTDDDGLRFRLIAACNGALANPATTRGLHDLSVPKLWLERGCDLERVILPTLAEVSHRAKPPIRTWGYFTEEVVRRQAKGFNGLSAIQRSDADGVSNGGLTGKLERPIAGNGTAPDKISITRNSDPEACKAWAAYAEWRKLELPNGTEARRVMSAIVTMLENCDCALVPTRLPPADSGEPVSDACVSTGDV